MVAQVMDAVTICYQIRHKYNTQDLQEDHNWVVGLVDVFGSKGD
jgi:hypothetical protein